MFGSRTSDLGSLSDKKWNAFYSAAAWPRVHREVRLTVLVVLFVR